MERPENQVADWGIDREEEILPFRPGIDQALGRGIDPGVEIRLQHVLEILLARETVVVWGVYRFAKELLTVPHQIFRIPLDESDRCNTVNIPQGPYIHLVLRLG